MRGQGRGKVGGEGRVLVMMVSVAVAVVAMAASVAGGGGARRPQALKVRCSSGDALWLGVAGPPAHLQRALVQVALHVRQGDAHLGSRHQRKVQHVRHLRGHVLSRGSLRQLLRLLQQLVLQELGVIKQALGVGAGWRVYEAGRQGALRMTGVAWVGGQIVCAGGGWHAVGGGGGT